MAGPIKLKIMESSEKQKYKLMSHDIFWSCKAVEIYDSGLSNPYFTVEDGLFSFKHVI